MHFLTVCLQVKQQLLAMIFQSNAKAHMDVIPGIHTHIRAGLLQFNNPTEFKGIDAIIHTESTALAVFNSTTPAKSSEDDPLQAASSFRTPSKSGTNSSLPIALAGSSSAIGPHMSPQFTQQLSAYAMRNSQVNDSNMPKIISDGPGKSAGLHFFLEDPAKIMSKFADQMDAEQGGAWHMAASIQASYLGQLVKLLEVLQVNYNNDLIVQLREQRINHSNVNSLHHNKQKDPALWEQMMRECDSSAAAGRRAVPFVLHSLYAAEEQSTDLFADSNQHIFGNSNRLLSCLSILEDESNDQQLVSDWTLFLVFVEETCSQIERMLEMVYKPGQDLQQAEDWIKANWQAAEAGLFLQYMHAVGVFLGLCLRTGCGAYLHFPHEQLFLQVLTNNSHDPHAAAFTCAAALVMRFGICAIYPEPCLDLMCEDELRSVLCDGSPASRVAFDLRMHAVYEAPLQAADYHMECFWMCVYDLPADHCRALVREIFPDALQGSRVSMLVPVAEGAEDIVVMQAEHSVMVPRLPSLQAMQTAVQQLVSRILRPRL